MRAPCFRCDTRPTLSEYDPTDIQTQEEEDELHAALAFSLQESVDADLRWLMSGRRGRRIVHRFLQQHPILERSFTPNAAQTAYNEGEKAFTRWLLAELGRVCPDGYHQMMREASR